MSLRHRVSFFSIVCFFFAYLFIFNSDYDNENNGDGERQGKRSRPHREPLSTGVEKASVRRDGTAEMRDNDSRMTRNDKENRPRRR